MKNISLLQGYIYLILAIIAGIASNGFLKTTEGFTKFNATWSCIHFGCSVLVSGVR